MSSINTYLQEQVRLKNIPGYNYGIYNSQGLIESGFGGFAQKTEGERLVREDTLFDIASLTKPIVTASSYLLLHDNFDVDLNRTVGDILADRCPDDKKSITLLDLLSHRSGYAAWAPLYLFGRDQPEITEHLLNMPLTYPVGTNAIYSCLGYILLGFLLPELIDETLEIFAQKHIFKPLSMKCSCFHPDQALKTTTAATECGNMYEQKMVHDHYDGSAQLRQYLLIGEVNDGNAHALGGVAGNAGLFSNREDVGIFALMLLRDGMAGSKIFFSPQSFIQLNRCHGRNMDERFGIGWHLFHPGWSGGSALSFYSFGHTGFTGCAFWIDPKKDLAFVLLTNRIHPDAKNVSIRRIRKEFVLLSVKKHF